MAEKMLNTRIILRNDDLGTWNDNPNRELKAGEVALVRVNTTMPNGQGGSYSVPTYLMKVGAYKEAPSTEKPEGTLYKFSELNWLAAPASDVHAWAKAATKPTYTGAEINVTVGSGDGATTKSVSEFIETLSAAIGEGGTVASQIETAIAAALETLVETDDETGAFITDITQKDGKITISRRNLTASDIPPLGFDKLPGLQEALNAKATVADLTTLSTLVQGADGNGGLKQGLANEISQREDADEALSDRIDQLAADIGNVSNIMNFRGVVPNTYTEDGSEEVKIYETMAAAITASGIFGQGTEASPNKPASDGDVIIYGNKEYVYSDAAWVEFGDASGNANAITALSGRVTTAEGKIATLEEDSSTHATTAYVDEELAKKLDVTTFNAHVTNVVNPLVSTVGNAESGLVKDVADLQGTVGNAESGLVKDVAELKVASASHATTDALNAQEDRIDAVYSKFGDGTTLADVLIFDCGTATANW